MCYIVTYRNNGGLHETIRLEAESRAALFAELSKRGISAIRVEEATGKAKRAKQAKAAVASRKPSPVRGLFAGIVVIALAVAAWYYLLPTIEQVKAKREKKTSLIAEATPEIAAQPSVREVEPEEEPDKPLPPQKIGEIRDGMLLLPNGDMQKVTNVITSNVARVNTKYKIFSHHSENTIASILSIQPGQNMVGTPRYNGRFTEDFLESLKEPIIPTEEDSEDDRTLKRLVTEAKIQLKIAYDNGEDIEDIILQARKECQELARYKQQIKAMTMQEMKKCETEEDVESFIEAANLMLEQKGIAPLELGPISKLKLQLDE